MALRTLKQEIINEIDFNNLLIKFTPSQIAFTFNITQNYVYKTANLQRIESEKKFNNNTYSDTDEMKIGKRGVWKNSDNRKFLELNFLLESQNKEI